MKLGPSMLVALLAVGGCAEMDGGAGEDYAATLAPVNASGVTGTARFSLQGDQLRVEVDASGLTPNQQHPMHLHGKSGQNVDCAVQDPDGDGRLTHHEAEAAVGGAVLPLQPFPTADASGRIDFEHTYDVELEQVGPIPNRVIVLHGMQSGGQYVAAMPVACGAPAEVGG